MMVFRVLILVLIGLVSIGCGSGCGSTPVPEPSEPRPQAEVGDVGEFPEPRPMVEDESEEDRPPRPQEPAPPINDLASAERAVGRGYYAEASAWLADQQAPAAKLLLARVRLETSQYDDAATLAATLSSDRTLRVKAETLRGEALAARGRLDEAQAAFTGVGNEPRAFRAQVMLGRLLQRRGRDQEAEQQYMRLIEAYNDGTITERDPEGLFCVALAAWGLGSFQDANDAFRDSTRADATVAETQVEWALMFLEKYDAGNAEESVRAAYEANANYARAHAVMARIRLEQSFDFAAANRYTARALEIAPNLVMAHVTLGGMDLRDMSLADADADLDRALAIDPNDLEALSVRAAVRFLSDEPGAFDAARREVFQRNPRFSKFYSIVGEYADWEHRYPEIVRMAREAVQLDPDDAFAHATLGLNLLRMGEETEGLEALRNAWQRDRYNVHVFNTLELYDRVIPAQYQELESAPFVFRMHNDERPMLERYIPRTLRGAYDDMVRRYHFTPAGPLRIELFNDTQHFSVRTTGLPNVGVQGVCFGKVVTAISPGGAPFNWGQITWHELAHVFHIQLSHNHVPRWFTEGLAEYETIAARPEWRREDDGQLWEALSAGRLPPLSQMNRAFTHARSGEDMMVAYYASSQILVYIVERFGFDKIVEMLGRWGRGERDPAVVQGALGISIDTLDRDFRAHTRRRLAAYVNDFQVNPADYRNLAERRAAARSAPNDADAQAALAAALFVAEEVDESKTVAEGALRIAQDHPLARYVLAMIAFSRNEAPKGEQLLRQIVTSGHDGYGLRLELARSAIGRDDHAGARQDLEAATRLHPDRGEAWQGLALVAEQTNDAALRRATVERLALLDQHDREAWNELLTALERENAWDALRDRGESALMLDPHNPEVHRRLGLAYLRTGRPADALYEADSALLGEGVERGRVLLLKGEALRDLRRTREMREALRQATQADPALAADAQRIERGG
jgi:cellulose synthase operon protein C